MSITETVRPGTLNADVLRVAVVHPEPLIAIGIAATLGTQHGMQTSCHALPLQDPGRLDVVVADYETAAWLAGLTGHRHPLAVLATHLRESEVQRALSLGVRGYILRSCPPDELVQCVRAVASGSRFLSREVSNCLADTLARVSFTRRELQVLELLSHGACNKKIARHLDVAVGTTKAHVKSIFAKLNASTRTEAAMLAVQRGLVAPEDHPERA